MDAIICDYSGGDTFCCMCGGCDATKKHYNNKNNSFVISCYNPCDWLIYSSKNNFGEELRCHKICVCKLTYDNHIIIVRRRNLMIYDRFTTYLWRFYDYHMTHHKILCKSGPRIRTILASYCYHALLCISLSVRPSAVCHNPVLCGKAKHISPSASHAHVIVSPTKRHSNISTGTS